MCRRDADEQGRLAGARGVLERAVLRVIAAARGERDPEQGPTKLHAGRIVAAGGPLEPIPWCAVARLALRMVRASAGSRLTPHAVLAYEGSRRTTAAEAKTRPQLRRMQGSP